MPRSTLLLLAALLAGCTFRQAMTRGREAADQQDWPTAAEAFDQAAAADPDDLRARDAAADAHARWHEAALMRFDRGLATGDLAGAADALREADRASPRHPRTAAAQARLDLLTRQNEAEQLRAEARALGAGLADRARAYHLLARAHALDARDERPLAEARAALRQLAETAEAGGQASDATTAWDVLAQVEPGLHAEGRQAHRQRRAAAARARAEAAERRDQVGTAFVAYALAAALEDAPADAARRDALRVELLARTGLAVQVAVEGPASPALQAALQALATPVHPGAPTLAVHVLADEPRCTRRSTPRWPPASTSPVSAWCRTPSSAACGSRPGSTAPSCGAPRPTRSAPETSWRPWRSATGGSGRGPGSPPAGARGSAPPARSIARRGAATLRRPAAGAGARRRPHRAALRG
ncbi:MAG: hypothetical protein R3F60_32745 [bacterium]